jgi:hypothetical protein
MLPAGPLYVVISGGRMFANYVLQRYSADRTAAL